MKDRKAICLFCRHNSTFRNISLASQKWKSTSEPFVIPRVVIDLDAADNENVKSFEGLSKAEQESNLQAYNKRQHRKSWATSKAATLRYAKKSASWHKFELDGNHATPRDLLWYALLGEDNKAYPVQRDRANTAQRVGFRPSDGVLRKVQEIASVFVVDDAERLRNSGFRFDYQNIQDLRVKIGNCHDLDSLQEILSSFTSTKEGCQMLADNGDVLAESIRISRIRQSTHPGSASSSKVLRMLNNLHLKMDSVGVEIGTTLCNRGIHYAAKGFSLPAAKMYLEIALRNSYRPSWHYSNAPVELLCSYFNFENGENTSLHQRELHRKNTLTLLTGWENGGTARQGEYRQTSFGRYFVGQRTAGHRNEFYRKYIFTLAQLGLKDALLGEWEALSSQSSQSNLRIIDKHSMQLAHLFAIAFSIAGDSPTALSTLSTITDLPDDSFKNTRSRTPETLTHKVRNQTLWLRTIIFDHYKCLNLTATKEFWQRVSSDLENVPKDPKKALSILQKYLVVDYQRGVQLRKIELHNIEDQEALLVYPLQEGRPLYAKGLPPVERAAFEGLDSSRVPRELDETTQDHSSHDVKKPKSAKESSL